MTSLLKEFSDYSACLKFPSYSFYPKTRLDKKNLNTVHKTVKVNTNGSSIK